jgi:two-component system, NarL family, response regulator NreC
MPIRLLLASHYPIVREGIRLLLGAARDVNLIGEAEFLAEAPQKCRELQPDVVLLDEPAVAGSSGFRAVNHIVQSSQDSRIVVLTHNDDVAYARSMLAAGARGYVLKQSSSTQLIASVRTTALGHGFIDPQLSLALARHPPGGKRKLNPPLLSQRDLDVLSDLARGYTNRQTASHLNLTLRTVETYRARIYRKLHVRNRAELVDYAIAEGLLQ